MIQLSKDNGRPSNDEKAEERSLLARVVYFAPLLTLILHILELILKIIGVIK